MYGKLLLFLKYDDDRSAAGLKRRLLKDISRKPVLLLGILLVAFCWHVRAQDNQFIRMAAKPYADYYLQLENSVYKDIRLRDSVWVAETIRQMNEAGRLSGNRKWMLEALLLKAVYGYSRYVYLHGHDHWEIGRLAEETVRKLVFVAGQARKFGETDMQFRALYAIIKYCAITTDNYDLIFRYSHKLDNLLLGVSASEFPLKPVYYVEMALQYCSFREYETALSFFKKAVADPAVAFSQGVLVAACNYQGIIYRDYYGNLDISDSCFNRIQELLPPDISRSSRDESWSRIAKGNLGQNAYLRGEYDRAVSLLTEAVGTENPAEEEPSHSFAAEKLLTLADIFLKKDDLKRAKYYSDKAYMSLNIADNIEDNDAVDVFDGPLGLRVRYFSIMHNYWRLRGNQPMAFMYADSMLTLRTALENDFNLRKLNLVEQRVQRDGIEDDRQYSKTIFHVSLISGVGLSVLFVFLGLLYYSIRKIRRTYSSLIDKNKHWAYESALETDWKPGKTPDEIGKRCQRPSDEERRNVVEAHKLLLGGLFADPDLTLDALADKIGVNRNVLSRAVNLVTGKNFNQFVNEYRIKEAIRILSTPKNRTMYVEELYEQVGFKSRSAFYRTFREFTGLTPRKFRSNAQ